MRLLAVLGIALACILGAGLVDAKPTAKKKSPPFKSAEQVLTWINNYRHEPEPHRLPAAVTAMRELGLLKDIEQSGIYIGFIAGVIGANHDTSEILISDMFPIPPLDQIVVVKAIAYSGSADWKD